MKKSVFRGWCIWKSLFPEVGKCISAAWVAGYAAGETCSSLRRLCAAAPATCWLDPRARGAWVGAGKGMDRQKRKKSCKMRCCTRWMLQSSATIELRGVLTLVGNQPAPGFVAYDSEFCNFTIFVSKEGMIFWTVGQRPQIWFRRNT